MNKNILFVDDEIEILNGIKRMLFSMRSEWKLYFANSGEEALNILDDNNDIDVIISDMRMPKMDGVELLSIVKEKYPHILRIVLSGHQDEMRAVRVTGVAHQFLAKPSSPEVIKSTVVKAYFLRNYISNKKVLEIVTGIGELPGLPEIYLSLEEELRKEDVSINNIATLISKDISITAKILQVVNSSFFGLRMRITDIIQALNFLGINTIKAIILHTSVFTTKNLTAFGRNVCEVVANHSLKVGTFAKSLAMKETSDKLIQDDTLVAGILHDIGKIVLLTLPEYEERLINEKNLMNVSYEAIENDLFGFTHAEIGAYLLGIWGLPGPIVECTAFHHNPSKLKDNEFTALTAVHIANSFINTKAEVFEKLFSLKENGIEYDLDNYKKFFRKINFEYLKNTCKVDKLQEWLDLYQNFLLHNKGVI